ncbi:MAG: esterase family protein [Actinomycetota bacterium]|nr:esterase family protein [Actinomycetota bacterium]
MTLRIVDGPPGPPWEGDLEGSFDRLTVASELLADNPLGDPARRPLYVYVPAAADGSLPSVYVIQGLTGQLDMWGNRPAFRRTMIERVDDLFSARGCPPAVVVFVDAWTRFGGAQFLNSAGNGRYMDYLCDEIVPFVDDRYETLTHPGSRGITGHSSGGYGAMVVSMQRPDVFGGFVSSAGDALFEVCYLPDFPKSARTLRDRYDGSWDRFLEAFAESDPFDWDTMASLMNDWSMGLAYSPDPSAPGRAQVPYDVNGRLIPEVWDLWLDHDPVRMVPRYVGALRSLKLVRIEAGRSDEYNLDLGASALSAALEQHGIDHTLDLFDGKHGGLLYRYPDHLRYLAEALTR